MKKIILTVFLALFTVAGYAQAPTTAAPAPPTIDANDVISLFSGAFTDINVTTFATDWSEGSTATDTVIDGNTAKIMNIVNFNGIQLDTEIDLSGFTHFHMDYWVADDLSAGEVYNVKLSNHANLPGTPGETSAVELTNPVTTAKDWVSLDVPLSDFAIAGGGSDARDKIYQIILASSGTLKKVYVDNIYFYNDGTGSGGGGGSVEGTQVFSENFDAATSVDGWTQAGDAASKPSEVTFEHAATAGIDGTGAMRFGGTNADGAGGRAYIVEKVFTGIDFGGATDAKVMVSIKSEGLTGTNLSALTDIGGNVVNVASLNPELSDSEFKVFMFDHMGISDQANAMKIQFNVAAGAAVDQGGTILIDDLKVLVPTGDGGGGGPQPGQELLTNGDFELGNDGSWTGNAVDIRTEGGNSYNFADVATAGDAFAVNISQTVALAPGETYVLSFDASTGSGNTRTMVAGIGQSAAPFYAATKVVDLTDTNQRFTLELVAKDDGTGNDFGDATSRVLFDMGAATGVVVIDNVSLIVKPDSVPELLTNGDFELGNDGSWTGNAVDIRTEGGNSYNFADVATAGDAFAVNISQTVALAPGETYVLSFDASTGSGNTRTMVAGIGQSAAPFYAATKVVDLTDTNQRFTLELVAKDDGTGNDFGDATSRVLFDMGAATGVVVIDNVSLKVKIGDNGGGGGNEDPAPMVAAPTPPTRNAEDVISIYSNAYTNITVDAYSASFDDSDVTETSVEGDSLLKIDFTNFVGIDFQNDKQDASAMTHFHMDFWTAESDLVGKVFNLKFSQWGGTTGEVSAFELPLNTGTTPAVESGKWVSVDVPISDWTNAPQTRDDIAQFLITSNLDIVYVDNIYLYKGLPISVEEPSEGPSRFALEQNYPNPFNPTTNISYSIPQSGLVTLDVFNIQGQKVATLVNELKPSGSHTVTFDAANLASGVYLYRLVSGSSVKIQKMMLIK